MAYTVNTLTNIAPILVREGLLAFRENAVAAGLCGFDVSEELAQKNQTISVTIPTVIPAQEINVSSANTPTVVTPTTVDIQLNNWWEAAFSMSDQDINRVRPGYLPAQAAEAIKSLSNKVDVSVVALYKDIYGWYGTAGTTPSSIADIAGVMGILDRQLASEMDRNLLLNIDTNVSLLSQGDFVNVDKTGSTEALRRASLGELYGFDLYKDQNMPSHTKGTIASDKAATDMAAAGVLAIGVTAATVNSAAATGMTGTLLVGDVFTFATSTQSHVVSTSATAASDKIIFTFQPALDTATADGTIFTLKANHGVNLAFNKYAFTFASRPLASQQGLGSIIETVVDPLSGISLRLEISRNARTKQTTWAYDILWGVKTIYANLAARLAS